MRPTCGSYCAGIGGLDLGLERAGFEIRWQCEIDEYCQAVLAKHWPYVKRYGDARKVRWEDVERVDLICAGIPCQPFSLAGHRKGITDDRWLWPDLAGTLRILRPRFVLIENPPGLLSDGESEPVDDAAAESLLTNGMGTILGDFSRLGYDAEWQAVPAAAFGAPHLRYRVFVVAYACQQQWIRKHQQKSRGEVPSVVAPNGQFGDVAYPHEGGRRTGEPSIPGQSQSDTTGCDVDVADPRCTPREDGLASQGRDGQGFAGGRKRRDVSYATSLGRGRRADNEGEEAAERDRPAAVRDPAGAGLPERPSEAGLREQPTAERAGALVDANAIGRDGRSRIFGERWRQEPADCGFWPTECRLGLHADGLCPGLDASGNIIPEVFVEGWECGIPRTVKGQKNRVARLRALGNAVVPQVSEWVGRRIIRAMRNAKDVRGGA